MTRVLTLLVSGVRGVPGARERLAPVEPFSTGGQGSGEGAWAARRDDRPGEGEILAGHALRWDVVSLEHWLDLNA